MYFWEIFCIILFNKVWVVLWFVLFFLELDGFIILIVFFFCLNVIFLFKVFDNLFLGFLIVIWFLLKVIVMLLGMLIIFLLIWFMLWYFFIFYY